MSRAVRRPDVGSPELNRMLKVVERDFRANVSPALVAHHHFLSPAERARRKARRALRRARRDLNRAA